jgi:hypothetical protein
MARKTTIYGVTADNRDHGKSFHITEMSAEAAEWWAFRCLQALAKTEFDVDGIAKALRTEPELGDAGHLAEFARHGLKALAAIDPKEAKPLLEELMACVALQLPGNVVRPLLGSDIEELSTRLALRLETIKLHIGFFTNGASPIGG